MWWQWVNKRSKTVMFVLTRSQYRLYGISVLCTFWHTDCICWLLAARDGTGKCFLIFCLIVLAEWVPSDLVHKTLRGQQITCWFCTAARCWHFTCNDNMATLCIIAIKSKYTMRCTQAWANTHTQCTYADARIETNKQATQLITISFVFCSFVCPYLLSLVGREIRMF